MFLILFAFVLGMIAILAVLFASAMGDELGSDLKAKCTKDHTIYNQRTPDSNS